MKEAIANAIKSGQAKLKVKGLRWALDCERRIAAAEFDLGEGVKYELGVFEISEKYKNPLITFYATNFIDVSGLFSAKELKELTERVWGAYEKQEAATAAKKIEQLKAEIARLEKIGKEVA
jgi:hypothetical protein